MVLICLKPNIELLVNKLQLVEQTNNSCTIFITCLTSNSNVD